MNEMDLKHSVTAESVAGSYIPNSKSTDLIKPSKSGNLDNKPPPGEEEIKIQDDANICSCYLREKFLNIFFLSYRRI